MSHRPSLRSRPEKTAFSLALTLVSARTYSRHVVAGVKITGALGNSDVDKWSLLCPQSETCSSRKVRKTFETVKATTLMMLKLRSRHEVCKVSLCQGLLKIHKSNEVGDAILASFRHAHLNHLITLFMFYFVSRSVFVALFFPRAYFYAFAICVYGARLFI